MNKLLKVGMIVGVLGVVAGCQSIQKPVSSLELQNIQTRIFDSDKRAVFNGAVQSLQDAGFTISSADYDTGFITAESTISTGFWSVRSSALTVFIRPATTPKTPTIIPTFNNLFIIIFSIHYCY